MDCFDTCEAVYEDEKCKPSKTHQVTNGKLCKNFAYLLQEKPLLEPTIEQQSVDLDEALTQLTNKLQTVEAQKVLYYKGSGNLGVMQSLPKYFFSHYGATLTQGSLCDGVGSYGLKKGRGGININPTLDKLMNADVILVWGRNLTVTSAHMYELVKDKTFITIDPVCTPIAKKSEVHLQLHPKTDHELALLMTRFAYMNDMEDQEHFESFAQGDDWFFDLAKERPLVSYESTTGVSLSDVTKAMDIMKDKKVAILVGLGVQKYYEGAQIMHTIDSFATYIGVHNKKAGGVWYLQDSAYGYEKPYTLADNNKKVNLPEVDFSNYEVVFIQGANPVVSHPHTQNVIEGLKKSFVVYFGTTHNETCEYANIVIPSTHFLAKNDVRLSYGHELKALSSAVKKPAKNTISEYALTSFLNQSFGLTALPSEEDILSYYCNYTPDIVREIETFEFVEELDIEPLYEEKTQEEFYFITAKQSDCLNSQFKVDHRAYVHSSIGYEEGTLVRLKSQYGDALFELAHNDDIKKNCVLVYAGAKHGNYLTPNKSDMEASSAMFQEVLVTIELP